MVDVDEVLSKLRKGLLPTEQEIKLLCDKAREILEPLENIDQKRISNKSGKSIIKFKYELWKILFSWPQ